MGRSRKPLTGQPVRGFESHPLRHSLSTRLERAVLDAPTPGDLLYWFRSTRRAVPGGPAIPRPMTTTSKKAVPRETDFSAQQSSPEADARIPGGEAHPSWPGGHRPAAPEGTQAPERLMPDREPRSRPASGVTGQRLPSERLSSERLPSEQTVRRRADYLRCYRTGRRRQGSLALLYFVPNQREGPRLGITASRKVGNAVIRHRLKRRIKEIYRRWQDRSQLPALDLVVHLKPEAGKSDFPTLRAEVQRRHSGRRERRGSPA